MNKFEDTMKQMQQNVEELSKYVAEKTKELNNSETKEKVEVLVKKTQDAIGASMKKVNDVIGNVADDDKLDEFLDKIKAKSQEAVNFTKDKVDSMTRTSAPSLEDLGKEIMAEFDKLKDTEVFKNTADFLKDLGGKINEFMDKPEIQSAITKAKTTTINLAEAGVDGLKKVLKTEPAETKCTEETPCCKEAEEGTCCCKEETPAEPENTQE